MKFKEQIEAKIHTIDSIAEQLKKWRGQGDKIVFTNGCFDLIHQGHINYLADAADLGDKLIIAVNTDASVSEIKGPHRPLKDENSRSIILAALQFTDAIILFGEPTPIDLISSILPEVLVKGGDYKISEIIGHEVVQANGGLVTTIPITEGYSTTNIEKKILDSQRED
jgi:rfaE bifunctional protein nucleotidyltransferase chain/domain